MHALILSLTLGDAAYASPIACGTISDESVYTCGTWYDGAKSISPKGGGQFVLLHTTTHREPITSRHRLPLPIGLYEGPEGDPLNRPGVFGSNLTLPPLRWQVAAGRVYMLAITYGPLARSARDMWMFRIVPALVSVSTESTLAWPAPALPFPSGLWGRVVRAPLIESRDTFCHFNEMLPPHELVVPDKPPHLMNHFIARQDLPGDTAFRPFDFLVISELAIEAYVLYPGGWLMQFVFNRVSPEGVDVKRRVVGRAAWDEGFRVVANGDRRFVVSDSGKVFALPQDPAVSTDLKPVREGSRVRALLRDNSSGKSYAFTSEDYFEIRDKVIPIPHRVTYDRVVTADDALVAIRNCARQLRKSP